MALPTDTRALGDLVTTTLDIVLPTLTDNFFNTNALWMRLWQRNEAGEGTIEDGGAEIKIPIIYAGTPAGSYTRGKTFGTGQTETLTSLQFQWKRAYAELNLDGGDVALNAEAGERQLFRLVETKAKVAYMSLCDLMGYQIYATADNGSGVAIANVAEDLNVDWDGVFNGVDNSAGTYTTYGGITRIATRGTPGGSINAVVLNAQNQPLSKSLIQLGYGKTTFNETKADLGVTTQDIWNDLWNRVEPSDRNQPGPLREVGFDTIRFNRMEIVADSHVIAGDFWGLNTEFFQLFMLRGRDMVSRAAASGYGEKGFPVYNADAYVNQIICMGNLVCPGPRFQFHIKNIKASS